MKTVYALGFVGFAAFSVRGQAALYAQCGGKGWTGDTTCIDGECTYQNDYYSQCLQARVGTTDTSTTPTATTPCTTPTTTTDEAGLYTQCGGRGWTGPTTCVSGTICTTENDWYSQCLPASQRVTGTSSSKTRATTSSPANSITTSSRSAPTTSSHSTPSTKSSPITSTTTSTSATPTGSCSAGPPASAGKLRYAGVNIAGFDFGMNTDGEGTASAAYPPLADYHGADGAGQMTHFANDDKYNIFRLPVTWQFLTDNIPTGTLNQKYYALYDALVQACLATGASCIIDIHNYARWNGDIIGQGGPSNEDFASLWGSLAKRYVHQSKVIFGIMNEPHDLPGIDLWAETVQAVVTAIRKAGATTQIILLPGDSYASAETFVSGGSAAALSTVTNPDGSHTNLVFDVHRYLDSDGSGSSDTCVTNNIAGTWEPLAQWLRCHRRQVLVTETGGGNTPSCELFMCQQLQFLAKNSDVFFGYVGWAAGSFATTYALGETPTQNGDTWDDQPLVTTCMAPSVNGYLAW